jgi:hypothetical protein
MEIFTILLKAFAACAGVYFLFSIGRLLFTLFSPRKQAPVSVDSIATEHGLLTLNPSEGAEDWVLQESQFPFRIHVLGFPPDIALLRFLVPIMEQVDQLLRQVEAAGSTAEDTELHLLYERKGTCYFDVVLPSQEVQMGYSPSKGVYPL